MSARPLCSYCLAEAQPCKAWVGCHPGSEEPLGRLANQALRRWRNRAHEAFDVLHRGKGAPLTKQAAYAWLAVQLQQPAADCQFGNFDEVTCRFVEDLCRREHLKLIREGRFT
jgi:hypothetical protein